MSEAPATKKKPTKMSLADFQKDGKTSWADSTDDPKEPASDSYRAGDRGGYDRGGYDRGGYDRQDRGGYGDRGGYSDRGYGDRGGGRGYDRGGDRDRDRDRDRDERRPPREPLPVPDSPPFIAYVGNLAYNLEEKELGDFFAALCKVQQVRIVRDTDRRPKGFAYVYFEDRESLEIGLTANGVDFMGRTMRVDVASQPQQTRGGFSSSEADTGPWRRDDRPPVQERPHRGGDDYGRRGGAGGGAGAGAGGDSNEGPWRRGETPSGQASRPKLSLTPRSQPAEPAAVPPVADYSKAKSNPFGAAKPRDESEYERKKEQERLQREKEKPSDGSGSAGGEAKDKDKEGKSANDVKNRFAALHMED